MKKIIYGLILMLVTIMTLEIGLGKTYALGETLYIVNTSSVITLSTDEVVCKGYTIETSFDGSLVIPATTMVGAEEKKIVGLEWHNVNSTDFTRFNANKAITSIDLSNATNLRVIGEKAFYKSTNLAGTLYLPASLLSIGANAFKDTQLTEIYVNRYVKENVGGEDVLTSDGYTAITENSFSCTTTPVFYFLSQEMLDDYKQLSGWNTIDATRMLVVETPEEEPTPENPETPEDPEVDPEPENPNPDEGGEEEIIKEINVIFNLDYITTAAAPDSLIRAYGKTLNCIKTTEWALDELYKLPVVVRDYYTFKGWTTSDGTIVDETLLLDENVVVDDKVELYASWEENCHTITYHYNTDIFKDKTLVMTFSEKDGLVLDTLETKSFMNKWQGWYLNSTLTEKTASIEVGCDHDVELWANYTNFTPTIDINMSDVNGEELSIVNYDTIVKFEAVTNNLPTDCNFSYTWYINDGSWISIGNTSSCTISNKLPKSYQVKCVLLMYNDNENVSISCSTVVEFKKYEISVDWPQNKVFNYTGQNYSLDYTINYPHTSLNNSCEVNLYIEDTNGFVECENINKAGKYKVEVLLLDAYKEVAEIVGVTSIEVSVVPANIYTCYVKDSDTITYDGLTHLPQISENSENWQSVGFYSSKLIERVYEFKSNTYNLIASYPVGTCSDAIKTRLSNAGEYYFELVLSDANFALANLKTSYTLKITPAKLSLTWGNVNFEYNNQIQTPSATCTGVKGENIDVVVAGGEKDANLADEKYTATATINNPNYTIENPTCLFNISKIACEFVHNITDNSYTKFYDGSKVQIVAKVVDEYGEIANNVSVWCETDLTRVGKHTVVLSWAGDRNHFQAVDEVLEIIIKTKNIEITSEDNSTIRVESAEGFASSNEISVSKETDSTKILSQEAYNNLSALYEIQDVYQISSTNKRNLTLNIAMPENITSTKQLKVFEIYGNGDTQEVEYTIENGEIKIKAYSQNSTFAIVCVKDNTSTVLIISIFSGVVLIAVAILVIVKRKKIKTNL